MLLRCIDAMHPYEPFLSLSRDFSYKICPVLTSSHPLITCRSKVPGWPNSKICQIVFGFVFVTWKNPEMGFR